MPAVRYSPLGEDEDPSSESGDEVALMLQNRKSRPDPKRLLDSYNVQKKEKGLECYGTHHLYSYCQTVMQLLLETSYCNLSMMWAIHLIFRY